MNNFIGKVLDHEDTPAHERLPNVKQIIDDAFGGEVKTNALKNMRQIIIDFTQTVSAERIRAVLSSIPGFEYHESRTGEFRMFGNTEGQEAELAI